MPDDRAYRIHIRFDAKSERFTARVPELEIETEAESRADAIASLEEAIEARISESAGEGAPLPEPADVVDIETAELTLSLSPPVHRDLEFYAKTSGMAVADLAQQLLSHALGSLTGERSRPPRKHQTPKKEPASEEAQQKEEGRKDLEEEGQDDRRGRGKQQRGRGGRRRKEGYRPDLDNQSNFLEYLRGMDKGRGRR